MSAPWDTLKLLADPTRLRLTALLQRDELAVAELQEILQMGQSRISSHLALLRQGGFLSDRREGKRTYYTLRRDLSRGERQLLEAALEAVAGETDVQEDQAQLKRILESRRQEAERYFNEVAGRLGKNYCPGRSWEAIGHFLLLLTPSIEIADLGAGEGVLSQLLARRARRVYCIDNSPRMVEVGRQLAEQHDIDNLEYKLGDIEKVPLADASVDLAFLSQALHHAEHPPQAIMEAVRILRPAGRLAILDLEEHTFEKAHELYADRWLGFRQGALHTYLREAGLQQVEVKAISREIQEPYFTTLLATGVKIAREG